MTAVYSIDKTVAFRPFDIESDFPSLVAFIAMQYEQEREFQRLARLHGGKVAPSYAENLLKVVEERRGCLVVAEAGGTPIGFVAAYCMKDPDPILAEEAREHGYVRDLFVLPNWRRMQVATRLLMEAEQHFRSVGLYQFRVGGPAQSVAMAELCRAYGFEAHHIVQGKTIPRPTHSVVDGQLIKNEEQEK